jgi:hypothetical protein
MEKQMAKNEVAKVEEEITDLTLFTVEEGQEEHLSQDELEIPFLKLAQKSTGQADEDSPLHIDGLKTGQWFNTVSESIFDGAVKFQVHGYFHNYVIFEGPKGKGTYQGTMTTDEFRVFEKANSLVRDGGDMVQATGGDKSDLRYVDTHNFIVSLPDYMEEGILIYALSSTGCKVARKWNSLHSNRRKGGSATKRYATIWELRTAGFDGKGFPYKQVSSIKPLDWANASQLAFGKSFEDFTKAIKEQGIKYSEDTSASEVEESDF